MIVPPTLTPPWAVVALLALLGFVTPAGAGDPPSPQWQPVLATSFKGDVADLGGTGLAVSRNRGCVSLLVEGKGVYCSPAGANRFKPVNETWQQVCAHADKVRDAKHVFVLADTCIKESR